MNCSTATISQTTISELAADDVLLASIIDEAVDFLCHPNPDMALCLEALIEVANQLRARNGNSPSPEVAVAASGVI